MKKYGTELTILAAFLSFVLFIICTLWATPKYKVYSKELNGQALLKEAEWSKKIKIEEAKADEEAALIKARAKVTLAKAEGESEIALAKGVSKANRIIGDSLKGNEAYLRYLWVKGLHDGKGERIYIPTEAGLPIFEAANKK